MLRERLAITRLRGTYPADIDGSERAAFDWLRERAVATGLSICAPESPYVSEDEAYLLAGLALLQRQRPPSDIEFPEELQAPLFDCARRLKAADIGLHLRLTPVRTAGRKHVRPTRRVVNTPAGIEPRHFLQRLTLQGKVFAFVSDRGMVTASELRRFGASRQVISIMYKRGLLRRARFGVYTASLIDVVLAGP